MRAEEALAIMIGGSGGDITLPKNVIYSEYPEDQVLITEIYPDNSEKYILAKFSQYATSMERLTSLKIYKKGAKLEGGKVVGEVHQTISFTNFYTG